MCNFVGVSMDYKKIPIFIISFNRLTILKKLILRLENDGYRNLHIVDNCSDNKTLIRYLHELPYHVYWMKKIGHMVVWKSGVFDEIINTQYYVVTDPDIIPICESPNNYVEHFYKVLQNYQNYDMDL